MKEKIESMKDTLQFKKIHPFSNKGEPLSMILKEQTDIDKICSFKHLIFNPNCQKEVIEKHLKKVHRSLIYAVHQLRKPADFESHMQFVSLGELKSNFSQNSEFFFIVLKLIRNLKIIKYTEKHT